MLRDLAEKFVTRWNRIIKFLKFTVQYLFFVQYVLKTQR
jgi:hypothetical protein